MTTEHQIEDLTPSAELDDLVKELDAILDAWFMSDAVPALEKARRTAPGTSERTQAA
jgi:hypothetical protein